MDFHADSYSRDQVLQILRDYGITPTHQRMEIAHVLFSQHGHLSADRILALVNQEHCETSKATVYNTLKLFLEKKLIREVLVDPTRVFYDANTEPHHHWYNVDTGELTDIKAGDVQIQALPPVPSGLKVEAVDVIVRVRSTSAE